MAELGSGSGLYKMLFGGGRPKKQQALPPAPETGTPNTSGDSIAGVPKGIGLPDEDVSDKRKSDIKKAFGM